jgi:predicted regulator of Ras-like GTPase activity (Roadblock/LC7/MglB family)
MPSKQKHPVVYLALSPAMLATALGLHFQDIAEAIERGELGPVYVKGVKRRILVSDAERWLRSWEVSNAPRKKRKTQ